MFAFWCLGLGVGGLGFGFWILDFGFWVLGLGFWVLGLGFWVLGLGFWNSGFGIWGLGIGDWGLMIGDWGLRFRVRGLGFGGLGFGVLGLGFGAWDLGFRVSGLKSRVRVSSFGSKGGQTASSKGRCTGWLFNLPGFAQGQLFLGLRFRVTDLGMSLLGFRVYWGLGFIDPQPYFVVEVSVEILRHEQRRPKGPPTVQGLTAPELSSYTSILGDA